MDTPTYPNKRVTSFPFNTKYYCPVIGYAMCNMTHDLWSVMEQPVLTVK